MRREQLKALRNLADGPLLGQFETLDAARKDPKAPGLHEPERDLLRHLVAESRRRHLAIPRWVDEYLATRADGDVESNAPERCQGPCGEWMDPRELIFVFDSLDAQGGLLLCPGCLERSNAEFA